MSAEDPSAGPSHMEAPNAAAVRPEPPAPVPGWVEREATDYSAIGGRSGPLTFGGNARVYEWDDEYGDVGPKISDFEIELFGDPANRGDTGAGLDFTKIAEIPVEQQGPVKIDHIKSFDDAGLHPAMLENVKLAGYSVPTPIQKYTIPSILQGFDVIAIAQTGSGKTAAYLVPILSKLMGKVKKLAAPRPNPSAVQEGMNGVTAEPLVLIVVPTRELAVQIFNEARKFSYRTMLRPCVVYGGMPAREQTHLLSMGCDILIGTPGRLIEFIHKPHIVTLRRLKYIVIDEADEMLNDDWHDDMEAILNGGEQDSGNVKFCLFSATFPKNARDLAKEYLAANHVRFRVGRIGSTTANIKQIVIEADPASKRGLLLDLLRDMPGMRTIIFANSRHEVDNLDDFLYNSGLPVTSIHSERTQVEREYAMRQFRSGNAPILAATGVTARGIDVRNVMHVINYDLPSMDHGGIEEYTHRIGRTGRIGHRGLATSFFTERDEPIASVLTRTLIETGQDIPEFLEVYTEGCTRENVKFEVESDFDPDDLGGATDADGGGGGWGAPAEGGNDNPGGGWGSGENAGATDQAAGDSWGGSGGGDGGDPAATASANQAGWDSSAPPKNDGFNSGAASGWDSNAPAATDTW